VTTYVSGPHGTWLGSAAVANVQTGEPMRPDARMRLDSVSKWWVMAVILQLAQEGKLTLGDTVERWLPGLLPYGNRITIGELMTDTSGLIDDNDVLRSPTAYLARVNDAKLRAQLTALGARLRANPANEASPLWLIRLAAWQPLLFTPGSRYHHSNIGWNVVGLIAARAGGKPLPVLYRERIFQRSGSSTAPTTRRDRSPGRTRRATASPPTARSPTRRQWPHSKARTVRSSPTPPTPRPFSPG
jgi:D-alanyl-D-alanine carboxypeptidase